MLDSRFQLCSIHWLFDRLAAHVGWCLSNNLCSIKRWIDFAFDQTFRPTILVDEKLLEWFAALPTKLHPQAGHVRPASQSRIAILFLKKPRLLASFAKPRRRTIRTSWLQLTKSQLQTVRKENKERKRSEFERIGKLNHVLKCRRILQR